MNATMLILILAISTGLLVTGLGDVPRELADRNLTQGEGTNGLLQAVKHIQDNQGHLGLVTGALVIITGIIAMLVIRALVTTLEVSLTVLDNQLTRHQATITRVALRTVARMRRPPKEQKAGPRTYPPT